MSASFRSILQQVTQEKLAELKQQKDLMTAHFNPVLEKTAAIKEKKSALSQLYEAVKGSPVKDTIDSVLIENLKYVLQNGEEDPSISDQLLAAWIQRVTGEVSYALRKCEYSYLYGSLLSEWLEVEEKRRRKGEVAEKGPGEEAPQEDKGKEAREKVVNELKGLMFAAPKDFDGEGFRKFLVGELFAFGDNVDGETIFKNVVKETEDFFKPENYYISTHDVQCCIKGLCSDELMSPEKKAALKELSDNGEALEEVASLLSNRLKNVDRWDWPSYVAEEVTEIRRGLAGEYKSFLNEDIITALFLQYVGVEWAAYFKRQFIRILESKAWVKKDCKHQSIEQQRRDFYRRAFLSMLPDSVQSQESKNVDEYAKIVADEMEADDMVYEAMAAPQSGGFAFGAPAAPRSAKMMSMNTMSKRVARCPPPPRPPVPDIDFKQQFLHVLTTEVKLNNVLRPEKPLFVVQADLEAFGPSIIHDAALIALETLGVNKRWLSFFKRFLQPNIRFTEGDKAQKVLRGVPSAHVLSKLFGETLLFLMDFLVNRKCDGMRIFRVADELWFWSPSGEHVTKAWDTLHTYGKMVGLKVNENRSGSVTVFSEPELTKKFGSLENAKIVCGPAPLPQRNIHWGYLLLGSNGVFQIDQKAVEKFLDEMKNLLDKSECVLEWINVFNKYFTFFIRNFGKSAVASGRQHLDQIVKSLNKIYSGLPSTDPIACLKKKYPQLMNTDCVDAWIYWPLERGGLGLVNPFISIMALRESFAEAEKHSIDRDFSRLPLEDKQLYEELKKQHESIYGAQGQGEPAFGMPTPPPRRPHAPVHPKLPTWEEYVASRETELQHWHYRYIHLLSRPGPKFPSVSDRFHTLELPSKVEDDETERNYFMWLFTYYETQLQQHFGNVTFINSKLLPMSMIANIQKTKVRHA